MQARGFSEQHGNEQISLATEDDLRHAAALAGLPGSHCEGLHHDVGIGAFGVRVRVMAVVLAHPPAVAEPDPEIAEQNAQDIADPSGSADLAMPRIVAEEAELGKHDREIDGNRQLPPGVTHQQEYGPASEEQPQTDRDPPSVMSRAQIKQARLPYLA